MASRKARHFRAVFARNFLKIHTFSSNIDIFRNYLCDKKNLIWYIYPRAFARGYKTHNEFHKYRMK